MTTAAQRQPEKNSLEPHDQAERDIAQSGLEPGVLPVDRESAAVSGSGSKLLEGWEAPAGVSQGTEKPAWQTSSDASQTLNELNKESTVRPLGADIIKEAKVLKPEEAKSRMKALLDRLNADDGPNVLNAARLVRDIQDAHKEKNSEVDNL